MTSPSGQGEEHPKGTLALTVLLGVAFAVVYLAVYFLIYVPRGPVTQ